MRKVLLSFAITLGALSGVNAQNGDATAKRIFTVKHQPEFVDNYSYKVFYLSDGKVYNLMNFKLSDKAKNISQMAIQPGGATCAILINEKASKLPKFLAKDADTNASDIQSRVEIYDSETANKLVAKINDTSNQTAMCYSPDGKTLAVGNTGNEVRLYDTKQHIQYTAINTGITPQGLAISENNYFIAVSNGETIEIWNLQQNSLRATLPNNGAMITSFAFSPDNMMLAVTSADGNVRVYNTYSFSEQYYFDGIGNASSCHFHPDNKYLGIVKNDKTMLLQNVRNPLDKQEIISYNGGIRNLRFVKDFNDLSKDFLLYPSGAGIVMQSLTGLNPNYGKVLTDRVNERMEEWMQPLAGESMEDFRLRIGDSEAVNKQRIMFENEIATEMAGDRVSMETITLGGFNADKNMLTLDFEGMPSIALDVPQDEISLFSNPKNLRFENTIYGLNDKDEFEVIYTEVFNSETGKTYTYNNLDRKPLSLGDDFVPFELVSQASMEQITLENHKKEIFETAKAQNLISDNTHIDVNTQVLSDVDANGNRILNYKIGYKYEVEKNFSAKEDFPSGKYIITESNAAMTMLSVIKKAFQSDFAKYIVPGKRVRIKITGSADAAHILNRIAYNGCYGEFANELVYKNGQLSNISVSKASGIKENDQLAFMRAMGVKDYIDNNITELKSMDCEYQYDIELANKTGGQFRRINVEFLFIDAMEKQ